MVSRWNEVAHATGLVGADGQMRPTIFAEMSSLAAKFGAANLGQGFPDKDGPQWIREAAVDAIRTGKNQYSPGRGISALRQAIADHQRRHYGIELDPETEVLVTAGATEALTAAILALAGPGDEVVTLEPFYDSHAAAIAMAGATHVTVPLVPTSGGFRPVLDALESAVTQRTRIILLNTPHNPTGTVLTREEMGAFAAAAERADAIVLTDEVYEHLLFDGAEHIPFATLPNMRERTLTVSSSGKTFSFTGWKIGWISGPTHLIDATLSIKQFLTYVNGAPFQPAIAAALTHGDADIAELRDALEKRNTLLLSGLESLGFTVMQPAGTYFVCADTTPFLSAEVADGAAFARWLPEHIGVSCVPISAFCKEGSDTAHTLSNWVRFTFVKDESTIRTALKRLGNLEQTQALEPFNAADATNSLPPHGERTHHATVSR